jgi:magnesium chelatase family protein
MNQENVSLQKPMIDLADILGQAHVKRALEIVAVGGHSLLITGAPGCGKTLLIRALPGFSPPSCLTVELPLGSDDRSLGAFLREQRAGALVLGDLVCWSATALALLRQRAEDRPHLALIAEMRPCPCGNDGDPGCLCTCSDEERAAYQARVAPLREHFAIIVAVARLEYAQLADTRRAEDSTTVRARVQGARARQEQRWQGTLLTCNAEMGPVEVRDVCEVGASGATLLKTATRQLHLSARAFHRILKLARTIADLEESDLIQDQHLAEAIQYAGR